jgi:hypothetical protein
MSRPILKPADYDPLTYTGELHITKHSLFGRFNLHEIILFFAGALGLIGFFLPWLTFQMYGEPRVVFGYSFTRDVELLHPHPEVWFLPMVSIFFLGRSLLVAQLRKRTNFPVWPMMVLTFIFSFILFAIPALIGVDADKLIRPVAGITFLNNAEAGWYFAIVGGILAIVGACGALVEPFIAKHYTKKGTTARTAKWGFATAAQMQPQPAAAGTPAEGIPTHPSEGMGAPGAAPSFEYAGAQPEGYAEGAQWGAPQWGGGPDFSQMTPSERKKYEKAMKKQMKEWQKQMKKQQKMYGGGPQF